MTSKLQPHSRTNNLPPPLIETAATRKQPSPFATKVHINGGGKCGSAADEEFSRQLGELKTMYEDLIGFAEAMLEQSKYCLRQIQRSNFSESIEKSCEDLIAAISDHRENLVRDLKFVEAKIVARGRVVSVTNRVQH